MVENFSKIISVAESNLGRLVKHADIYDVNKSVYDKPLESNLQSVESNRVSEVSLDSNGKKYAIDGDLIPNNTYELNNMSCKTDDYGRISHFEAKELHISPDNIRDSSAQQNVGGIDRRPNDHGGHIISRELGGNSGIGNLIPMDARINQSDYRQMERLTKTLIENDNFKLIKGDLSYSDLSRRPDAIHVEIQCKNGEVYKYIFNNNMDKSLINIVSDSSRYMVYARLEDKAGGVISSICKHYDSVNSPTNEKYFITYEDAGITKRTMVNIDFNK